MSRLHSIFALVSGELPLWLLGTLFVISAAVLGAPGLKMAASDLEWSRGNTTTGRVILTEWKQEQGENRLAVLYGYQDERGIIYHSTGILARKLGKINLEPGMPYVVVYKPDDHSKSKMQLELGQREWIPIVLIAASELLVGMLFLTVAFRRLLQRMRHSNQSSLQTAKQEVAADIESLPGKGSSL
jgi:hypothetical protein